MATILGIFTAILLAASIFVGMKNNKRLEDEITNRQSEQALLKASQDRLKAAQEVLDALPIERAGIDEEFAKMTEEETKLKDEVASLRSDIETKTRQIADNKEKLDEVREKLAKVGNIPDLASKMKQMRADLEALVAQIAANEATLASLTEQNERTQADSDRRRIELETLGRGQSLPSLKTRIRSIYPSWGFVTLADGNYAGVNTSSTLDVMRDGEVIAKLLVTAVESRSASATIIPDSLAEDVTLMVGDRVVASTKVEVEPKVIVPPVVKPLADKPAVEEPPAEEPAVEEPAPEESPAEEPAAEEDAEADPFAE